jgi:hypothetical protein
MYQSYPTSDQPQQPQQQVQPPNTVLNAVKLMYAGAALSVLGIIISLVTIGSLKSDILRRAPNDTTTQVHNAEIVVIVAAVIGGLIAIGLWLWMAWANKRGRNWARIVSTVLFVIDTLELLVSLHRAHAVLALVFDLLVWLVGLGAIILLFNKQSSPFFKQSGPA